MNKYGISISRVDFIQIAAEYKPVNLGQGFPNDHEFVPDHVLKALKDVALDSSVLTHQYARGFVSITICKTNYANYTEVLRSC